MNSLHRQIKLAEKKLDLDNAYLEMQYSVLQKNQKTPQLILVGFIGSFIAGYCYARKKNPIQLIAGISLLSARTKTLYQNIKFLLPQLPI